MSYSYLAEKPKIYTEAGLSDYVALRSHVYKLIRASGACLADRALQAPTKSGDTWFKMALLEHAIAQGDFKFVNSAPGERWAWQDRIVVAGPAFEKT